MKDSKVLLSARQIISIDSDNKEELLIANQNYIEAVCLSSIDELKHMLTVMLNEDYMSFPFWARLLAFRILCSLTPNDTDLKNWAESDISAFGGPEWDNKIKW